MSDFLAALGLLLVIEGVLYAGLPAFMKRMALDISGMPVGRLRAIGLAAAFAGLLLTFAIRG